MSTPGLLPALSLIAGAIAGQAATPGAEFLAWLLPSIWAVAVVFWWRERAWLALLALVVGLVAGGAALASDAFDHALHSTARARLDDEYGGFLIESIGPGGRHDPLPARLTLGEDAAMRDGFVSLRGQLHALLLRGSWQPVEGGVVISAGGTVDPALADSWRAGRTIEAPVTFRRPATYLNDGVTDFERDLALAGVTLLGSVKSGLLVTIVEPGNLLSEFAASVRAHVRRACARWIASQAPLSAAIAAAVLIGDRAGLPDEIRERLQMAGTYHVIAISGGNIAILATLVLILLALLGVRGRFAAVAAIVMLVGYVLAITSGPSVWRATLMAVLYFAARAIDHRTAVWHAATATAAVMVAASPLDVRDPGFILTFGATIALLHGARVGVALMPRSRLLSWLAASLIASIAVELALFPVSAWLFSQVTIAGLVLNLAAVPLMAVVQVAALVVAICSALPAVAEPAGYAAHLAAHALVESAQLTVVAPWMIARVPAPAVALVGAYYIALVAAIVSRRWTVRSVALTVLVAATLTICGAIDPAGWIPVTRPAPVLRLTMFDVGQGESMLLETPAHQRILIDTGGQPFGGGVDIGSRVLEPALWARGVRSLDAVLVTHGDPDHIGGALDVVADMAPRELWMGVPVARHGPTREVIELAGRQGVSVDWLRAGETRHQDGVAIRVLHPPAPDWERRRVRNDDSVVLEVVYRDVAILLTGDISADIEREILPQLTHAPTRILKVAHHGSRTSSSDALLAGWRPQFALVSAGRGNTFGHPTPEVLERLAAVGATVFRTDRDGQVTLETDGKVVRVETYEGQRSKGKGQR